MNNYRIVRRALPAALDKAAADDIIATAAELGDGRWSARQSLGLATYGLRARGRLATDGRRDRCWAQGIGFALIVMFLVRGIMWGLHGSGLASVGPVLLGPRQWLIPIATSALALTLLLRSTRAWALVPIVAIEVGPLAVTVATGGTDLLLGTIPIRPIVAADLALLVAVALLHKLGDGRPAASPTSTLAAAVPVGIAAVVLGSAAYAALLVPALAVVGVLTIRLDPRWAIGGAMLMLLNLMSMLALGLTDIVTVGLVVLAGLVLMTAHRSVAHAHAV